jgi:hypothetical protein
VESRLDSSLLQQEVNIHVDVFACDLPLIVGSLHVENRV